MEQPNAVFYLVIALIAWLALLSFWTIKTIFRYRRLAKGVSGQNLDQVLEKITAGQNTQAKQILKIIEEVEKQKNAQYKHLQKFAIIRFNPFEDTGGDQSFVVSFLDQGNNGIVISSLHSRNGTRVYAKEVTNGKPTTYQFSKEEKEVIEKACLSERKTVQTKIQESANYN